MDDETDLHFNQDADQALRRGNPHDGSAWLSRGYLPHFDSGSLVQHVTFHLADSLPYEVIARIDDEIKSQPAERIGAERRKRLETWTDAGHGCCILREPIISQMVTDTLHYFDGQRYRLCAWVVMPNHIHVLFETLGDWSVAKIVASWKKHSAVQINAYLKSDELGEANQEIGVHSGVHTSVPVWHREYWDRFIRDEHHFVKTVEYIHMNPVKAGLVSVDSDWLWSSARL